jgi:tetratricopeptide (TPR) repeat protein
MARVYLRCGWPLLMLLPMLAGCNRGTSASSTAVDSVTFCRDIAPILFARCANCHRPGETAPFNLLTYEDARARARQIRDVTERRFMPPWLPLESGTQFQGERRLSDKEIELLSKWVAAGAPEGNSRDLPPQPTYTSGWQLGPPDLVLESPAFELAASGPDRFRNFVLPVPLEHDRWIRAVEIRPENPRATHHARLGIDSAMESARRDAGDPQPGYEGMAWGQDPKGQLITWTPGMLPDMGLTGAAWKLSPGTRLVLHTHLQPTGKPESARCRIGLYYADAAPTIHPLILRVGSRNIDIPAGDAKYEANDEYRLPIDVDVHSVFPHAHKLCRQIDVRAILPNSTTQPLIEIRHFDEKWHDKYRYAVPLRLPQGTRLQTHFVYDNSTANERNPHNPPQRTVYGSNISDEMSDVFLQVTPVEADQYAVLDEDAQQTELRSKIVGYSKTLELYPSDMWSLEGLASCYIANHQPADAVQLLKSKSKLLEDSTQALTILGMAELASGDITSAEALLRRAIHADRRLPVAWAGAGQFFAKQEKFDSAEAAYRRALELAPAMTVARLDLIDLLIRRERIAEAAAEAQKAINLAPDEYLPLLKQANIYARQRNYPASLASFAEARKKAPFVYSPQSSLAIACYELGDELTANRLLNEAVTLDANDPVPRFFLGQIARRNSSWAEAAKNLQLALELPVPRTWPASHVRQFLKLIYTEQLLLAQQLQDDDFARSVLHNWMRFEPDNAAVRTMLGQIGASKSGQPVTGAAD